jgi:rare lipoprotein A
MDHLAATTPSALQNQKNERLSQQASDFRETGMASWYGKELHGKRTARGEIFDMYGLSAAHRTLPLGTIVHVTNLDNSKHVSVIINDRGPFLTDTFLALSYGAANELGFVPQGIARVRIDVRDIVSSPAKYTVQAAVFTEEENALLLKERLDVKFRVVSIKAFETNVSLFYCVRVGAYSSEAFAEKVADKLVLEGLEPIVMRQDR